MVYIVEYSGVHFNLFSKLGRGLYVPPSDLDPPVQQYYLVKNSEGKQVDFASCKDPTCAGGGIALFWSTNCEFCARPVEEGSPSYLRREVAVSDFTEACFFFQFFYFVLVYPLSGAKNKN